MFKEVEFSEVKEILSQLWPAHFEFIDNVHAQIGFAGEEISRLLVPKYFAWIEEGQIVGTTHCYRTGYGRVRVRGTFVSESMRGRKIGQKLVLSALEYFADCHEAYTFPRRGSEKFYSSIGFEVKSKGLDAPDGETTYGYAEKKLIPRLHFLGCRK